ncbi:hypothetical protein [Microbacterium sp.]|uniref:hypothetical protein n=1 Tax=Microbacterium sp. TaxID=51671 RepID=UPI0039E67437
MHHATASDLLRALQPRAALLDAGHSGRAIAAAVAGRELHRVRRGWYVAREEWDALWSEARHLAHVLAVNEDAAGTRPVFALASAAVLHGLPLYRVQPRRVHLIGAPGARRSIDDVYRHEADLDPDDVVEVDGMRCTSLARTVHDLARLASPEVAIAALDAAVGRIGGDPRRFDDDAAEAWRAELHGRARPRMRGIRRATALLDIADGRAQLPLEAVTTLQLWRLGFARPQLQVPVPGPNGRVFWMDIEIPGVGFYECDGLGKYVEPAMLAGRTSGQVVLDEKSREDWVRGVTGRRVLRGGSADSISSAALAARLRSFGVVLPPHRPHPFLPNLPVAHGL